MMKEAKLKDLIAEKIYKLKSDLTLLEKEQYIPNKHGTNSFIDLYAKDEKGHHAVIELKCNSCAAPQVIHEIYKYVEGVKQYFGAQYRSYRFEICSEQEKECSTFRDEKWRYCETVSLAKLFKNYVVKNQTLVNQILSRIRSHDKGDFFMI